MRERINRLARGILNFDQPVLSVQPESLALSVRRGEVLRTEISVNSANGFPIKGLIYSDHVRVRILRPSFGGQKNQLAVEADARFLDAGDEISGKFSLVTDGGETELPFCFTVTEGPAEEALQRLESLSAFAEIARQDPEAALRIFEYKNFPMAHFMRDLRLTALYEAFRKGPDRESALEEFLVAAGAKKPALVRTETERCDFAASDESRVKGSVRLIQVREGYFRLAVSAEGTFLRLARRSAASREFERGSFVFPFEINSAALHPGKNEGRLRFSSSAGSFSVPVTVLCEERAEGAERINETDGRVEQRQRAVRRRWERYLTLRLQFALSGGKATELFAPMEEALETLREAAYGEDTEGSRERVRLALLRAELCYLAGDRDGCAGFLSAPEATERVTWRKWAPEPFLAETLRVLLSAQELQRQALEEKIRMAVEMGNALLLPMLLLLNPSLRDDTDNFQELLSAAFRAGSRSPFLFAEYAALFERHPALIRTLDQETLAVLCFGLRHELSERTAAAYAAAAGNTRSFSALHYARLAALYARFPSDVVLTAVCTCLIRCDRRTEEAHAWYMRGVAHRIRLTGLNEYLVCSMPGHSEGPLPHEVFLYFSYDNRLDDRSREKLYENLCRFRNRERELWEEYRKQIEDFALAKLLAGRVNRRLAVLYKEVLCSGMIDRRLAAVLPGILNTQRIRVETAGIRAVLVLYPELSDIERVRVDEEGCAYVPVYSEDAVFLFEDAYENRFAAVSWKAERVCELQKLMELCVQLDPEGPVPLLSRLRAALAAADAAGGKLNAEELRTVRYALEQMKLSARCAARLRALLVSNAAECPDYFLSARMERFTGGERSILFGALCAAGRRSEAWELLVRFMPQIREWKKLAGLCSAVISEQMFPQEELLLKFSAQLFLEGAADTVILDYLCEHYNGATGDMLRILDAATAAGTETYDLEERLLAQMLFTGETAGLDAVFTRFREEKNPPEVMVRAYMTDRCMRYFTEDRAPDSVVFRYLELAFSEAADRDSLPLIYGLALTRHYSEAEQLQEEQRLLAERIIPELLDEGLYFSYYKKLARFIPLPEDVLNKEVLEFHGERDESYEIRMRILPGETDFRTEELPRMFLDCFVRREVLFEGERWEYELRRKNDGEHPVLSGVLLRETDDAEAGAASRSRYACLNELGRRLKNKNEAALRAGMEAFAAQKDLAAELFRIT